jgi:drug/metabolite transporter (DMT)-like permease
MFSSQFLGILSALASAFVWGSGDFTGGLAARRISSFRVVAITALVGLALNTLAAILLQEPFPSAGTIGWSCAAGLSGAVGIAALYRGLSTGSAAVVAPTSGVAAAIIPVIVGSLLEGLPRSAQLFGILLGLGGIYLVSRPHPVQESDREQHPAREKAARRRSDFLLGLAAGTGFGGFFVLIAQVEPNSLFAPLAFSKLAAFGLGAIVVLAKERSVSLLTGNPLAVLAGVLDAGGNLLFLLAVRYISLAIAGVLSSMYPAATVLLSMVILHERILRFQAVGVLVCLAAVAMITF